MATQIEIFETKTAAEQRANELEHDHFNYILTQDFLLTIKDGQNDQNIDLGGDVYILFIYADKLGA